MQATYSAEELLELIASGEFSFVEDTADSGCLTIKLEGILSSESRSLIKALQDSQTISGQSKDEGVYLNLIETVKKHPLYKPRNPALAIRQVAKDHSVTAEGLKQALSQHL